MLARYRAQSSTSSNSRDSAGRSLAVSTSLATGERQNAAHCPLVAFSRPAGGGGHGTSGTSAVTEAKAFGVFRRCRQMASV